MNKAHKAISLKDTSWPKDMEKQGWNFLAALRDAYSKEYYAARIDRPRAVRKDKPK
jgi:hypothetical protein